MGLVVFNFGKVKKTHIEEESPIGLLFVLASLLFDGFMNSVTDQNHKAQHRKYAYHSMLYTSLICCAGNMLFFAYAFFFLGDTTFARVIQDPVLTQNVLLISLCGAFG